MFSRGASGLLMAASLLPFLRIQPLMASGIVFSFDHSLSSGSAPCAGTQLEFFLEHESLASHEIVTIGRGLAAWADGQTGFLDINASNEPDFQPFANRITDGVDDNMLSGAFVFGCTGGGLLRPESSWLQGTPDLIGNELDFIRLIVHDVNIEQAGNGVLWQADLTYEFWGTPIPEPATLALLAFGGVLACRRPRPHRNRCMPPTSRQALESG